jgi:hypothetical protein
VLAGLGILGAAGLIKVSWDFRNSIQACRRRPPADEPPA